MTPYEFAVLNVQQYIRSPENAANVNAGEGLNAFEASRVLAIAFNKQHKDVLVDVIFMLPPTYE